MTARFLPEAREDLHRIWNYLLDASQSIEIADQFQRSIYAKCETYAKQPLSGELRPEYGTNTRCFLVGSYVVFYEPSDCGIVVLQVIHGSRDVSAQLRRIVE
jgi:toxin ParE1/3/4